MRRWVTVLALVALTAAACSSSSSRPLAQAKAGTMALLFVAGASGGSLSADSLVLNGVEPSVTWFSDRPARRAGRETVGTFLGHWAGFGFASDPPNAALSVGGGTTTVLELRSPHYDAGAHALSFSTKVLQAPRERLEFVKDKLGAPAPSTFGPANLFIDDADVPASVTPSGELEAGTPQPVVYVTFSGESKGGTNPINTVMGYAANGDSLDVLEKGANLSELRGMVLGADGSLYVANSHKSDTKIVLFGPPKSGGTRAYVGDYANHQDNAGLYHPYGLAVDPSGDLLASSQDTCVVTAFTGTTKGTPGPVAGWLQSNYPGQPFFEGTMVAEGTTGTDTDCPSNKTKVDGGVQWPRGIAVGGGNLYVADNPGHQVRTYDLATGAPKPSLFPMADPSNPPSPPPGPVGLYLSGSTLYVSSEGTNDVWAFDTSTGAGSEVIATTTPASPKDIVLDGPAGLTCGSDGALYLDNRKKHEVLRFDVAAQSASVLAEKLADEPEQIIAVASSPPVCG